MITIDKYNEIKKYVINRLSKENPFSINADDFYNKFNLIKPYYKELCLMIEKENMPFYTIASGKYMDRLGDPSNSDPIIFSDKPK